VEQAIVRALRDNLEGIQRSADELHHAVRDVVSACGSNKPTNALPSLLRAQASAASLAATLEVLSRFVASSMHSGSRSPLEAQITDLVGKVAPEPTPAPQRPAPPQPVPKAAPAPPAPVARVVQEVVEELEPAELELPPEPEPLPPMEPTAAALASEPEIDGDFDVNRLSAEEQELHRRANRVAKVSMQDIKMLRPEQVRLGRQNKDLCIRLKDDIEKAHREYDRRFKPIMDHPVDYFFRWMVEILADGDAHALGDYPYATPARHH
jgi:outer membrane biosynthesis protein TonB